MAFINYTSLTLRASAASSGTSDQDSAVTLPETVNEIWIVVEKTAEDNADNVLTVRLQAQVNTIWFDISWDSLTTTGALATAADTNANVTRTPNILDADSTAPTYQVIAHFTEIPSNVIRSIWIASGTVPVHTFDVIAYFQINRF